MIKVAFKLMHCKGGGVIQNRLQTIKRGRRCWHAFPSIKISTSVCRIYGNIIRSEQFF